MGSNPIPNAMITKKELVQLKFFTNGMYNKLIDEEEGLLLESEKLSVQDKKVLKILQKLIKKLEEIGD